MTYKSVVVTARGGIDGLKIIENELRPPATGEARVRVLATTACQDDIAARVGNRPFLPKVPFVPGYAIVGVVEALGDGASGVAIGDRVAALTQLGGWAEMIYLPAEKLMPVPETLDPAQVIPLMLNYLVAYQVLHGAVDAQPGQTGLIIGASGGVGMAFAELGKLAGMKLYGLASPAKHGALMEMGVTPVDYHAPDFLETIKRLEPDGLDYVFNGMGEETFDWGISLLRRGGTFVHYGGPQSFSRFLLLVWKLLVLNLIPNGKTLKGYGTHTVDIEPLKRDWAILFHLLEGGKIHPPIACTLPILEAAKASELLESGQVTGNIVLVSPDLSIKGS